MRFWPFGGGKKKNQNKREDPYQKIAQEKSYQDPMARTERNEPRDPEKMTGADSRLQSTEASKKLPKATVSATKESGPKPPSRSQIRSAPAGSSSKHQLPQKSFVEHFATHEPIWSSERGSTTDAASSMYRQNPGSRSSIGPETFNVTKTPPTLRRRSDQDQSLPRHKSSKRKAEELAREREVRAMSSPIPVPKRSTRRSDGPLRKETKDIPGGMNIHLERPKSEVSLPLPETFSEMGDYPDQHSFKVNAFAVLSPRPTIKYNGSSRFASPRDTANQSRASTRQLIVEEDPDFSSKKRIENLADSLDSGGLRELMERDQRRREKKRESDKAKLHRKLQRRAERQREDEQHRARGLDARPQTPRGKNVRRSGLGIDTDMSRSPAADTAEARQDERLQNSSPVAQSPAQERPIGEDPFADERMGENTPEGYEPILDDEEQAEAAVDPFSHAADKETEVPVDAAKDPFLEDNDQEPALPAPAAEPTFHQDTEDRGMHVQSPIEVEEAERTAPVVLSPPTSPVQAPAGHATFVQEPALTKAKSADVRQSVETGRGESGQGSAPASTWTSFFKKGGRRKRSSTDRGRTTPEFSNTSRESFSRQQPPPSAPPRSFRRSGSGAPQRTRSKFREDLPELPISPPDSRVQSPDLVESHHATTVPRSDSAEPIQSAAPLAEGKSLATSSSIPTLDRSASRQDGQLSQQRSMDFPLSDAPATAPGLSQSLASVDSEASWLSGKPAKRSSLPTGHPLRQSQSSLNQTFAAAGAAEPTDEREENDVADDEYFHRLTPAPEESRRISDTSAMRKASSTVINLGGEGEPSPEPELPLLPDREGETWHGSVGRQATIVRQTSRAKSKEGLLNQFIADDPDLSSGDEEEALSPDFETPAEEFKNSPILRARSVEYGKGHARHISAGSARLLDIRRSSVVPEAGLDSPTTARSSTMLPSGEVENAPE